MIDILYFDYPLYIVTEIPMIDNSSPDELRCTVCLLPMQYQAKKDGKLLWQCFKCGKQYLISGDATDVEENWSPPR